jgi:hypothetical protein
MNDHPTGHAVLSPLFAQNLVQRLEQLNNVDQFTDSSSLALPFALFQLFQTDSSVASSSDSPALLGGRSLPRSGRATPFATLQIVKRSQLKVQLFMPSTRTARPSSYNGSNICQPTGVVMQQETVTLIVAGLGIAGTLTSGPITQYFARHSQRDQWELDKRSEEFRELLDALTVAYLDACEIRRLARIGIARDVEDDGEIEPTVIEMTAYRLLRNRIFTAIDLEAEDVAGRWDTALINFKRSGQIETFAARFSSISATIVWLSTKKGNRPKHI